MKKKNVLYIVGGLIFFSLLSSSISIVAWRNGLHTIGTYHGTIGEDPIPLYKNDYTKSISPNTLREYYGTQVWIAESALELLYDRLGRPTSGFIYHLWNLNNPDNLRIYYLFGSELPNHNSLPSGLKTKCNFQFERSHFQLGSHTKLRFYDSGPLKGSLKDDSACKAANKLYSEIKEAFKVKDCQAAAFIGAEMHIIADATYFYHLLDNVDTDYFSFHVTYTTYKRVS